ncbi:MAG TPA: SRPBCC domain-containing protein [Flavobacteriales bacterium]
MQKLHFTQHIRATRERVWDVLWNDRTYPQWTAPFGEGGKAVSDWKEGSRVLFLSAEGDGMYGLLDRVDPPASLSITHQGAYRDGKEQPQDEASREWSGAKEQYTLTARDGGTELSVSVNVVDSEIEPFRKMFPAALLRVKELAERPQG